MASDRASAGRAPGLARPQLPAGRFAAWRLCVLLSLLLLCSSILPRLAHADEGTDDAVPRTFSYTEPADENHVRAMLELTGVLAFGFMFYASMNHFNVHYSWPIFRSKLTGQALELDSSGYNTNFVGHPIGGTNYYMTARSNQLSIAESFAIALGSAVLWEFFGEVREIVSINDIIVTSVAGLAIGEPLMQLSTFFDRSSPALRNRILACVFAPLKSLNDALDGRTLARAESFDEHGFPRNEWHQFELRLGAAETIEDSPVAHAPRDVSRELRLSLASQLVRLPGYDDAGDRSLVFTDANASSMHVDAALTGAGLVDLDVNTQVAFIGHSYRSASYDAHGGLWGEGALLGVTVGFQYVLHDYDRDRARPKDGISTVQPLGLLFEHRAEMGDARLITRLAGGGDFGGVRPYAYRAYGLHPQPVVLPVILTTDRYYFALGGHLLASMMLGVGRLVEVGGTLRYESYSEVGAPISIGDRKTTLEARASVGLGDWPARVSLLAQRKSRAGHMGDARAARGETSLGVELGARY